MNRFRLFLENFLVYGIGGVVSKIVPLIMLPLVTRLMPNTAYFGINDLFQVIVSFGTAIAVMGMYDAMFRMFFDREDIEYKKDICSGTMVFVLFTSVILLLLLLLFRKSLSEAVFGSADYSNLLMISAFSILAGAVQSIAAAPTRMNNKKKVFLLTNTLSPLLSYGIAVPMLIKGNYIYALPCAQLSSSIIIAVFFGILNQKWFRPKRFCMKYIKEMLPIALPLLPNFIIYWVFHSSDRLMITAMLGAGAAGIYGVGARIGHISQIIYTAFTGGWQYFAFSTMKDQDQVELTSNIFEYLGALAFLSGAWIAVFAKTIFQLCFPNMYLGGAVTVPYLFLTSLLLMLYQTAASQFLVIKKTKPTVIILSVGAVSNVILNYLLIPRLGIEGAAIATLAGYVISVTVCVTVLIRMKLLYITSRFICCSLFGIVFLLLWRFLFMDILAIGLAAGFILTLCYLYLYRNELIAVVRRPRLDKDII